MNYRIVISTLGLILVFIGLTMLAALPFSFYYASGDHLGIIFSSLISISVGAAGYLSKPRIEDKWRRDIRPKEAFAIVGLSWVLMAAFGSLPFLLTGAIASPTDAFFETMSGFTTTGATILTDVEALPHGVLFWRSFTHWLGGMGIIVLSIAILPFLGVAGMQLFKAEVPGPTADKLTPRVTETAKILWAVYFLLTIIETVLLMFGGMSFFDALCHTFGTMATGGYSTKNASIAAFNSAFIEYVVVIFMLLAGINFSLHYRVIRGDFKGLWRSEELRLFLILIVLSTLLIGYDLFANELAGAADSFRYAIFQVLSIITTTGYGTADYEQWSVSSQLILLFLMFVGGCAGSTAGGLKVVRLLLLLKFAYSEVARLLHPKAIIPVRLNGNPVERSVLTNISGFFVVYMLIAGISVVIISFFGLDLETSIGAVVATLNNIGPGLGDVGPTDNYAFLPSVVKWLLSFLMLLGRLEIFTILVLLTPAFWKK